ncbi:hypothetical protein [Pseudomonas sp. 43A]|uniref:hypothetical protein n=1 Tax=unclassified Pseudomonas TaxID=196821 RepID=UPI00353222E1
MSVTGKLYGHSGPPREVDPMNQTLLDLDLKRVSREHYITGKAAINLPHAESTTDAWHLVLYFERETGISKVSLEGIQYPDTTNVGGLTKMEAPPARLATKNTAYKDQHCSTYCEFGDRFFFSECRYAVQCIAIGLVS